MPEPSSELKPQDKPGWNPSTHGTTAQWVSAIASVSAVIISAVAIYLTLSFHSAAKESAAGDEHTNGLIEEKLTPAVNGINGRLNGIDEKIGKLEGRFDQLDAEHKKLVELQLNRLSAQINAAHQSGRTLDLPAIVQLGENVQSFVHSQDKTVAGAAWHTAIQLANYKTLLTRKAAAPILAATTYSPAQTAYPWFMIEGRVVDPRLGAGVAFAVDNSKSVPLSEAARYEGIGTPNESGNPGFPYISVTADKGTELVLDGHRLKNVVMHDAQVAYDGGPLIVENVFFVNCTFRLSPAPNSNTDALTSAVLATAPATNFSTERAGD